jgi:PTH1 family peptidyl-tRNA hydrolase
MRSSTRGGAIREAPMTGILRKTLQHWLGRQRRERAPQSLVVGLGNPGETYSRTRHNAGFRVVEHLAGQYRLTFDQPHHGASLAFGAISGRRVALVKPQAFMNRSGPPVLRLMTDYGMASRHVLVIHDDLDLDIGRIKIKEKGGHGGHNGLKSLMDAMETADFPRLRIGIGRPQPGGDIVDYVLGAFSAEENQRFDAVLPRACAAAVTILCEGAREGMNRFNQRNRQVQS